MLKSSSSKTAKILEFLYESSGSTFRSYESVLLHLGQAFSSRPKEFYNIIRDLKRRGIIDTTLKNNTQSIALTAQGELEVLFLKAAFKTPARWDGKWRMVLFDIPENMRQKRNILRALLYQNGFQKLQASVFINPWPLNREAILYLQKSGLIEFIRIVRIDEMDNDKDLRRLFKLPR